MISVAIVGTGSALPKAIHHTDDLIRQAFPQADEDSKRRVRERAGIETRHWVGPGESAASLATAALAAALERAGMQASALRRVILATSTGGDHLVPATAHDVVAAFGLSDSCDAFDVSNSCVGFLTGLDIGARSVATGVGPTAVIAVEVFSRLLSPEGPRAYVVLGDAAAAAVLTGTERGGLRASCLYASEWLRGRMSMAHPGTPGARPYHDFDARSHELGESATACIRKSVADALSVAKVGIQNVDWVLLHQPNQTLFDALVDMLKVDRERTIPIVKEVGSLGSASVAMSLDRLLRTRDVKSGQLILLASVGAGTAHGAMLYEVP